MNIRFVEYGKRFVRHGTTDFVILAASDQDIIKNLGYFRSILKYPSRTSFNNDLGSVSVTLLAFNEGFLFVQLQNRREDELSGSESQMRRPFNQIRFSFLSRDDLLELFSKGKAVYTSLLFSDPNKETQFLLSDYADEKVSEPLINSDSGILMSTREDLLRRYETAQFHNDVETITDALATYLNNGKNSLVVEAANLILPHLPQNKSLLYKLVLLQEAQHYLFPFRQIITFALDNITEQNVVVRFYGSDYIGTTQSSSKPTSSPASIGYYRAIKLLKDYLYEDNLARYIKSKLISMEDLVKLYPLTKGKSKFQPGEHTTLLLKYYPLLLNDPTKEKDIPNDFYHVISQISRDDMVNLLNSELDDELSQWLVNILRLTPAELIYVFTSLKQQRRDKMLPSFISTLPAIDIHALEEFSSDQLDAFWKSILLVARDRNEKLVFASDKRVVGVLLNEYLSSKKALHLRYIVEESLAGGNKFTDVLMSELNAIGNYTISDLLHMIAICNAVSESGVKDQKWNNEFGNYFTTEILKAAIKIRHQSNYSSDHLEWERLILHITEIQKKTLVEIMVLHNTFIEELTHVFSNVAQYDMGFAKNWLFCSFKHSYTHRALFVKIYDILRLTYKSHLEQLNAGKHLDESDAGFYYLVSIGVFPKGHSILRSLKVIPESSPELHEGLYLVTELWMGQNWWVDSTQLGSDDVGTLIDDLQECRDFSKAQHINNILVFIIQHQQNACRNIDAQLGKKWLQSALKTWDQPGSKDPIRLYDSYIATSEGIKNDLWACLSDLNSPDEEFLWELSGMDEVLSGSLEKCQEYLAKWYLKMSNLQLVDERLAQYLKVSQTDFPQSYHLDGSILKTIRNLVAVKHMSATYKCNNDREAELLLAIVKIVQDESITNLAKHYFQKFTDESKHISEELFLKLLDTDIRIENKLFNAYINDVSAKHNFTTQINSLNANQVGRIHKWAEDVSARPVLDITKRRLLELNISFSPQKPEELENTRSEIAQRKVDLLPVDDSDATSTTEPESNLPNTDNQKKNNIEIVVANDENETVTISKTKYRVIIFLLILCLVVDLVMIVQYVIVLPQLLGL